MSEKLGVKQRVCSLQKYKEKDLSEKLGVKQRVCSLQKYMEGEIFMRNQLANRIIKASIWIFVGICFFVVAIMTFISLKSFYGLSALIPSGICLIIGVVRIIFAVKDYQDEKKRLG